MLSLAFADLRPLVAQANERQARAGLALLATLGLAPAPLAALSYRLVPGDLCERCGQGICAGIFVKRHARFCPGRPPSPQPSRSRRPSDMHRASRQKGSHR